MALSTAVLGRFYAAASGRVPLIGVGGIASGCADALAKIRAGAAAVQLYSAMVYEGPGLVGRIQRDLAGRAVAGRGFASARVAQAVGSA